VISLIDGDMEISFCLLERSVQKTGSEERMAVVKVEGCYGKKKGRTLYVEDILYSAANPYCHIVHAQ